MDNFPMNFYDNEKMLELNEHIFDITNFDELDRLLESESGYLQYMATIGIRKLLSIEENTPIDIAVQHNCIPKLLNVIQQNLFPKMVYEAAWALTNIASGTDQHTWLVLQNNAAQVFNSLLSSGFDEIVDQALWCLGNLIGNNVECRDLVIRIIGLTDKLCILASNNQQKVIQGQSIFCLSNCFKFKPIPQISNITKVMMERIADSNDEELKISVLWALSHCDVEYHLNLMKENEFVSILISSLREENMKLVLPSLRILGNFAAMDQPEYSDMIINCGILSALAFILQFRYQNKPIIREVLWLTSNITAGTQEQIDQICEVPELLKQTCELFESTMAQDIRKESSYVVSNIIAYASFRHCKVLTETKVFHTLLQCLISKESQYQLRSLSAIKDLVQKSIINEKQSQEAQQTCQNWIKFLEDLDSEYEWVNKVKALITSPEQQIRQLAKQILTLKNIECGELEGEIDQVFESEGEEAEEEEEEEVGEGDPEEQEEEHDQMEGNGGQE